MKLVAQKPLVPKSRKIVKRARKQAATDSVKRVKKAVGVRESTPDNIDSLINKHLATFRNAEKALAEAKALVQTYRQKYPELTDYIPRAVEECGSELVRHRAFENNSILFRKAMDHPGGFGAQLAAQGGPFAGDRPCALRNQLLG